MGLNLKTDDLLFIDTSPFIYYFENNKNYIKQLDRLFDMVYQNSIQIITSMITYSEIITYPAKMNNKKLVAQYRNYFTLSENISLFPIDVAIADETILFRVKHKLRTPDAIQLATAHRCGAAYIITNDSKWKKISTVPVYLIRDI